MGTFLKKRIFFKKYYERVHAKQTKKYILKKNQFTVGQVIKILILVNKNIKYDIY